ncbi:MAG: hypothetical protein IT236_03375 [Bacteroidia bacterium]|nr:hypothetical protein [Bacteroidia bacterium]
MTTAEKTYYSSGQLKTIYNFFNGVKHGDFVRYFENGQIEIQASFVDGKKEGKWIEYYESGQVAEEGEYTSSGEYNVINFWTDTGEQLLINGTGKTIRKFGASQGDIYEQYFENGKFICEKKIQGVSYGKFIPKTG